MKGMKAVTQFLTVKQMFYPQISVSRIDVGVLDHASGCIVYYKTRLQKYAVQI